MLRAYFNYPNSRVCVHGDASCNHIQQAGKPGQRCVFIDRTTLATETTGFLEGKHSFAANAATNDLWVDLDLADADFERALVAYFARLLGERYKPFASVDLEICC